MGSRVELDAVARAIIDDNRYMRMLELREELDEAERFADPARAGRGVPRRGHALPVRRRRRLRGERQLDLWSTVPG